MREPNIIDRLALAKISEYIADLEKLSGQDILWFSDIFKITEYQQYYQKYLLSNSPLLTRQQTFNFLLIIFRQYPDIFHIILSELVKKDLRAVMVENIVKNKNDIKKFADTWKTVTNSFIVYTKMLGYETQIEYEPSLLEFIEIRMTRIEIDEKRKDNINRLLTILEKESDIEYNALKGAYERVLNGGPDAYRQAIDSCRNAYHNFFKRLTNNNEWSKDLSNLINSDTLCKLIRDINSYLSGHGTHSTSSRSERDAFLAIRLTEDIMIRTLEEIGDY